MKSLLAILLAAAFAMPVLAAEEAPKTKKSCVMQKDAKTGKEKEVCKTIKVHKKHEGTAVEGASKEPAKAPAKK
jgi:azurin